MGKKRTKTRDHKGLQAITLCISTAMVLILLGMVVFSVLTAKNLSTYVKENLTVTMMLSEDMTNPEALRLCRTLKTRPYVSGLTFISKEQVLEEQKQELGVDPSEFAGGNPYTSSIELRLAADYANQDSLKWISKELKKNTQVQELEYPLDLINDVNRHRCAFVVCFLYPYQQYSKTWHLCPSFLHSHHETGGCILGLHPSSVHEEGLLYRRLCRIDCHHRVRCRHLCALHL